MRYRNHIARAGLLALSVAALAAPAAADWIVTTEGQEIETKGPWRQQGRLLVLTLAENGELVSMRASEVDLEASEALTAERAAGAAASAAPETTGKTRELGVRPAGETRSVIVLTDADFTRRAPSTDVQVEVDGEPVEAGSEPGVEATGETPAPASALTVIEWEEAEDPDSGGVVLAGRLANQSRDSAAGGIRLRVRLYDTEGVMLEERDAQLSTQSLQPGDQSSFRVAFPDVPMFSAVKFEALSQLFQTGTTAAAEPTDG